MVIENPIKLKWCFKDRSRYIEMAKSEKFDVIIIGGGATGAGVARECALRGISFLLLDKNDFAYGTSSRSSKLTHGGLRYINNLQFKVVRESTTERNWLRTHFPNLVRPLAFNLTSYTDYMFSPFKIKAAMFLYHVFSDWFSKFKNYKKPVLLSADEFIKLEPKVRKENLIMGGYYYDCNVDDARLVLETIKEAVFVSQGKSCALNYAKVVDFIKNENGKIVGVKIEDQLTGEVYEASAIQVINCSGIWADDVLKKLGIDKNYIRPTKGVHLIIKNERLGNNQAFGLKSRIDGRFYFILRREKYTVIGTTDTDYDGDYDKPVCTKEDCEYLLDGVNFLFPEANLTEDDLISTYAGLRPLVADPKAKNPSEVSRKHVIMDHDNGLISLLGGKHTIYRKMAEDLFFHMIKRGIFNKKRFTRKQLKKGYSMQPFLVGLTREDFDSEYRRGVEAGEYPKLDDELISHLYRQYGKQSFEIMRRMKEKPELQERLFDENEFTYGELDWILDNEFAPKLMDVICRRTEMWMYVHHTKARELSEKVAKIMKEKYGWDDERTEKEIESYVNYVKEWVWF